MPLAASRQDGESNSAIVPLSRTRTLVKAKKWSGGQVSISPDLAFLGTEIPCSDASPPAVVKSVQHSACSKAGYFSCSGCFSGKCEAFSGIKYEDLFISPSRGSKILP